MVENKMSLPMLWRHSYVPSPCIWADLLDTSECNRGGPLMLNDRLDVVIQRAPNFPGTVTLHALTVMLWEAKPCGKSPRLGILGWEPHLVIPGQGLYMWVKHCPLHDLSPQAASDHQVSPFPSGSLDILTYRQPSLLLQWHPAQIPHSLSVSIMQRMFETTDLFLGGLWHSDSNWNNLCLMFSQFQ